MKIDLFITYFTQTFEELEPEQISPETILKELSIWDSLAILMVIALAGSEYQVTLTGQEVNGCETVSDLFNLIKNKRLLNGHE